MIVQTAGNQIHVSTQMKSQNMGESIYLSGNSENPRERLHCVGAARFQGLLLRCCKQHRTR